MKIKKTDLKQALEIVKPGLANKEIIEQSTSFAFMDGRVVTYNDEISISHPLEVSNLDGAIKAEEFYQILSKMKGTEVELTVNDNEIVIQSGKAKAGLIMQEEIKLPLEELGDMGKFKKLPKDFLQALKFVSNSTGTDMSRPVLTCINVRNDGWMDASDGYRICRHQWEEMDMAFLLPAAVVKHLVSLKVTKIGTGTGWVHFSNEAGTVLSCRIFEDKFPLVDKQMMAVTGIELMLPVTLNEMLERANVFSKRDHLIDENITITLTEKQLTISGKNEYGWYEESTPVRYTGEPVEFNFTPYMLQDILGKTNKCTVGKNKIRFEGEGWEFVAMLRLIK